MFIGRSTCKNIPKLLGIINIANHSDERLQINPAHIVFLWLCTMLCRAYKINAIVKFSRKIFGAIMKRLV